VIEGDGQAIEGLLEDIDIDCRERARGEGRLLGFGRGQDRAAVGRARKRRFSNETIDELSRKTGLSRAQIVQRLTAALPETVNRLTPDGRLPSETEAQGLIAGLGFPTAPL